MNVSGDYAALYQREDLPPPGSPSPTHVYPLQIKNRVPTEAGVEAEVFWLRKNRSGGHTYLQSEHFQTWLREAYLENKATPPPKTEKWIKIVELVQFMW